MSKLQKVFAFLILIFQVDFAYANSSWINSSWIGALAPDFKLQDQNEQWHSLEKYQGQWLILYFYPKDDTPGCTTEAKNFRDGYQEIIQMNAQVVGVSLDDVESHQEFATTHQLPFPLLADINEETSKAYDVLGGFGPLKYAKRQTFIIDPQGNIVHHFEEVKPETHMKEVIATLQQIQKPN
ncbi:MAG: peroxiredoxin [Kangiellaceae bacterium]|nr:peroxiredoxin [Kangiellaceae bacterium]